VLTRPLELGQYTAIHYGETLAALQPSVGSVGDAIDNALCETTIGLYKTEGSCTASAESHPQKPRPSTTLDYTPESTPVTHNGLCINRCFNPGEGASR
jgi:hypothetical protein